jgi:hypothetical protein
MVLHSTTEAHAFSTHTHTHTHTHLHMKRVSRTPNQKREHVTLDLLEKLIVIIPASVCGVCSWLLGKSDPLGPNNNLQPLRCRT